MDPMIDFQPLIKNGKAPKNVTPEQIAKAPRYKSPAEAVARQERWLNSKEGRAADARIQAAVAGRVQRLKGEFATINNYTKLINEQKAEIAAKEAARETFVNRKNALESQIDANKNIPEGEKLEFKAIAMNALMAYPDKPNEVRFALDSALKARGYDEPQKKGAGKAPVDVEAEIERGNARLESIGYAEGHPAYEALDDSIRKGNSLSDAMSDIAKRFQREGEIEKEKNIQGRRTRAREESLDDEIDKAMSGAMTVEEPGRYGTKKRPASPSEVAESLRKTKGPLDIRDYERINKGNLTPFQKRVIADYKAGFAYDVSRDIQGSGSAQELLKKRTPGELAYYINAAGGFDRIPDEEKRVIREVLAMGGE